MSSFIKTKAIVLSQMPIKDQDKRIVLFSVEYGKMIVFANGARRGKSPLLAGTQPFVFGEFHLVEGRDSYTLKHVDIIETFYSLREDLTTLSYALYLLEVTHHIISESDPNEELLRLLYISLLTLKLRQQDGKIVRRVFEFRAVCLLGYSPDLSQCLVCHQTKDTYELSHRGGLICTSCQPSNRHLTLETLEVLKYFQSANLNKLYHFKLDERRFEQLDWVIESYFKGHIQQSFKSLDIL